LEGDEDQEESEKALLETVEAMRSQLVEENLLPSLRPEKVLTQRQLEDIGTHRRLVDDVA
jgi:hypothetical protein